MICWGKLMLFTIFRRQENTQRNQTRTFVPIHVAWETVCSDGVVKILCNPYRNGFGGSVCTHSFAAQRANMQSWYVRVRRVALMINRGTHIAYKHTHTPPKREYCPILCLHVACIQTHTRRKCGAVRATLWWAYNIYVHLQHIVLISSVSETIWWFNSGTIQARVWKIEVGSRGAASAGGFTFTCYVQCCTCPEV